jgi:hypothetical protein
MLAQEASFPAPRSATPAGVTVPLHVLLQWDDEGDDRQAALQLFDAFAPTEKALHASSRGHSGVPASPVTPLRSSSPGTCG